MEILPKSRASAVWVPRQGRPGHHFGQESLTHSPVLLGYYLPYLLLNLLTGVRHGRFRGARAGGCDGELAARAACAR